MPCHAEDPITFTDYPPTFPDIPQGEDGSAEVVAVDATAEATATVELSGASTMSSQFSTTLTQGEGGDQAATITWETAARGIIQAKLEEVVMSLDSTQFQLDEPQGRPTGAPAPQRGWMPAKRAPD